MAIMNTPKTFDEKTMIILEQLKLLEALRAKGAPDSILKTFEKKMFTSIKNLRRLSSN